FNQECYNLLCAFFGKPPSKFTWIYNDNKNKYCEHKDLTPNIFYEKFVNVDLDRYVCVINDPRTGHEYQKLYTVPYLSGMVGGKEVTYLNLPINTIKR